MPRACSAMCGCDGGASASGTCLRVCYAMSGTGIAYGVISLREGCAMSGTDIAHAAALSCCMVLRDPRSRPYASATKSSHSRYGPLWSYGTAIANGTKGTLQSDSTAMSGRGRAWACGMRGHEMGSHGEGLRGMGSHGEKAVKAAGRKGGGSGGEQERKEGGGRERGRREEQRQVWRAGRLLTNKA
eukprot:2300831-Rhodomonas_salina.1